ncbi:MAG: APC family permease [Lactobacillaceae bacterium]|jgi:amino acid transporter|nr:APC family permease [Lactobacillaceae bacterium]
MNKMFSSNTLFLMGVNSIIGSGIFVLSGKLFIDAGSFSLVLIILAGLISTIIAFSYAQLAKIFPEGGGTWVYANKTFGNFWGFFAGAFDWLFGITTLAVETKAMLLVAQMLWPNVNSSLLSISGMSLLLILMIINLFGQSAVTWLDDLTSGLKITLIVVFVVIGLIFANWKNLNPISMHIFSNLGNLGNGFTSAFFLFAGFSFIPIHANQLKNGANVIEKLILQVMAFVTLFFLLVQLASILLLDSNALNVNIPAAAELLKVGGIFARNLFLFGLLISIFGVVINASFNAPDVLTTLAANHDVIPSTISKENKFGSAVIPTLVTGFGSVLLLASNNYALLVSLTVLFSLMIYSVTVMSAIFNDKGERKLDRIVNLIAIPSLLILVISLTIQSIVIGIILFALISGLYFYWSKA